MARIAQREVTEMLSFYLGSAALRSEPDFTRFLTNKLNVCLYTDTPLEEIRGALEQDLLVLIYAVSQKTMKTYMEDGSCKTWTMKALRELTDCVMETVFTHLEENADSYHALLSYAMNQHSLTALRVLYLRYGVFMSPREREIVIRLITEQFDAKDYQSWLSPADCPKREA